MSCLLKFKNTKAYFQDLDVRMAKAHVSQNALAEECGLTPNEVSRWRNGHVKSPRFDKILLLEHALYRLQQKKARR